MTTSEELGWVMADLVSHIWARAKRAGDFSSQLPGLNTECFTGTYFEAAR